MLLVALVCGGYLAVVAPLRHVTGVAPGVVGLAPVVVAGVLFGVRGALVGSALCVAGAIGFHLIAGAPGTALDLPAHLLHLAVGVVVGRLRDLGVALRRTLDDLGRAGSKLAEAQRIAHLASWELDLDTGATTWSEGLASMFGLEPGVRDTAQFIEHIHPNDRERVLEVQRRAVAERQGYDLDFRVVRPDGNTRFVHTRTQIVAGDDGRARLIGTTQDVTDRRALEARLMLADRLASMGTLAGGVAHEINNPLAYVVANLDFVRGELAKGKAADLDHVRQALADAEEGAHRIKVIVADLRTFARGDDESLSSVDVRTVIESAVALSRNEIRHRATLVLDHAVTAPVTANPARLGQVFVNLLVNAAHAIPEGRAAENLIRVVTRLVAGGAAIEVEVSDTGVGITPERRARIFDPFFTTKPIGSGIGLGLSVCHGIVEGLGGELRLVETEEGRGSRFAVRLPVAASAVAGASPPPVPAAQRGKVLVVDDEPILLDAMRRMLGFEHDVVVAGSGAEALAILEEEQFDVILLDVLMPQLTGMDVYRTLRLKHPDQAERVVFMTGGAFTTSAQAFLDGIPNLALDKPVPADRLRAVIAERVARRAA